MTRSVIPGTISITNLMEYFRRNKTDMVLVVDEFGGVAGAVTLTDLLEEMVGEMEDSTAIATMQHPRLVAKRRGT